MARNSLIYALQKTQALLASQLAQRQFESGLRRWSRAHGGAEAGSRRRPAFGDHDEGPIASYRAVGIGHRGAREDAIEDIEGGDLTGAGTQIARLRPACLISVMVGLSPGMARHSPSDGAKKSACREPGPTARERRRALPSLQPAPTGRLDVAVADGEVAGALEGPGTTVPSRTTGPLVLVSGLGEARARSR